MKRKKTQNIPAPAAPVPQAAESAAPLAAKPSVRRDVVLVALFSAVLLFSMLVQTGRVALILGGAAIVSLLWKKNWERLSGYVCLPVLGFAFWSLIQGCAAIYTPFEEAGTGEYYKFFASVAVVVIFLAWMGREHIRALLWGLMTVSAVIALISIDGAGCSVLWDGTNALIGLFGSSLDDVMQYEGAARVAGIYNDANITASIFALASFMGLYMLGTEKRRAGKLAASVLLGLNAIVFFLSLSRGAILCFGLALLVWLAVAGKGQRLALFIRMVISAASVMAFSIITMPFLASASPLADVLALVTGLPIFLLDMLLTERLAAALSGKTKALLVSGGLLAAAVVVFVALAVNLTGPYTYSSDSTFGRAVKLPEGSYTLSLEWEGEEPTVLIYNQTPRQAMLDEKVNYYEGPLSEAEFTVGPNDKGYTYFKITGKAGTTLISAQLSNGTALKLSYRLLPSSVADRLQGGLFSGSSTTLRLQFMVDALKIFAKSPVIGNGLSSTEGMYCSVQPFFYQSKYVHNQVLQVMADTGLVGLFGFLAFVGGALWLLIRRLRKGIDPLAAMLLACWAMMLSHSMMEFTFSIRGYQCFGFVVLLLPVLLYGESLFRDKGVVKKAGMVFTGAMALYLALFGGLLVSHRMVEREVQEYETHDLDEFLDKLVSFTRRDVFCGDQYRMLYVKNAMGSPNAAYNARTVEYAERLRETGMYTNCSALSKFYYMGTGQYEEAFAVSREAIANMASNSSSWNYQLETYYESFLPFLGPEEVGYVIDGTLALRDMLTGYREGHWEDIPLTENNQKWVDTVDQVFKEGFTGEEAYAVLLATAHTLSDEVSDYGK